MLREPRKGLKRERKNRETRTERKKKNKKKTKEGNQDVLREIKNNFTMV